MLGLMGSVAEFERSIIKERQAEGIAHAKARGVYKGRVKALTDVQVAQARQWICPKRRGAVELQLLADYIHGTPLTGVHLLQLLRESLKPHPASPNKRGTRPSRVGIFGEDLRRYSISGAS